MASPGQLKWSGDFTVQRYRASLSRLEKLPMSLKPDYTEEFNWDRGGLINQPYTTTEFPPVPRTQTELPSQLEVDPEKAAPSTKDIVRLPIIPPKAKTVRKSASCVNLISPYNGRFGLKEIWIEPEPIPKVKRSQASMEQLPVELNEKQIAATRKLWRESSTGDSYFKSGAEQVAGIADAMGQGASLDWRNPDCDGLSLFAKACMTNEFDLVKYLWTFNPDIATRDNNGRGIFHHCARHLACQTMTFVLRNIDPKQAAQLAVSRDDNGDTPMHLAAEKGTQVIANLLLKARGKEIITLVNKANKIPFDVAKENKMHHMLKLLDPLEYVNNQTSLISRIQAKLGPEGEEEGEGEGDEDEEEDEEDEEGGGTVKGKFKNLLNMDRHCNKEHAAIVKNKKKKGGKKKKKKK